MLALATMNDRSLTRRCGDPTAGTSSRIRNCLFAGVVGCSGALYALKSAFACASQRERRRVSTKRSQRQQATPRSDGREIQTHVRSRALAGAGAPHLIHLGLCLGALGIGFLRVKYAVGRELRRRQHSDRNMTREVSQIDRRGVCPRPGAPRHTLHVTRLSKSGRAATSRRRTHRVDLL